MKVHPTVSLGNPTFGRGAVREPNIMREALVTSAVVFAIIGVVVGFGSAFSSKSDTQPTPSRVAEPQKPAKTKSVSQFNPITSQAMTSRQRGRA